MNLISIRKLKFYTKEGLKLFNIALLAFGFIISVVLVKYKPMYEVKVSGIDVGYVENKKALNETIESNIENYSSKIIDKVELTENPEYKLKLVEKTQEDNENEVIVALQKKLEITYKYYEIDHFLNHIDFSYLMNKFNVTRDEILKYEVKSKVMSSCSSLEA